ncbi:hypothetical protein Tco_0144727 [Tanacetum coccineum]
MASMNNRLNIKKFDVNIVQKHGGLKQVGLKQLGSKQVGFKQLGHKQVGFKQLSPGVETGVHGVQVQKRVWFKVELQELKGIVKLRFFKIATMMLQWPKDDWRTNNLKKRQTRTAYQEGAEGNVAEKKKLKESMEANLGKLLKYNA